MFVKPTQEEINAAMERLVEIGWSRGSLQVREKGRVLLTPEGDASLRELGLLLTRLRPGNLGEFSAVAALALKKAAEAGDAA